MTIFSKIAAGEIPSYKCAESDKFYAFLDINPVAKAHTLVIPKQEVDYLFDMDDNSLAEMTIFAKRVAKAINKFVDMLEDLEDVQDVFTNMETTDEVDAALEAEG